jgi:hypothetical protein
MVLVIKKNTTPEQVRQILRQSKKKKNAKAKKLASFFGKLPRIEDGLHYQKKLRNEWE